VWQIFFRYNRHFTFALILFHELNGQIQLNQRIEKDENQKETVETDCGKCKCIQSIEGLVRPQKYG
jgi:hypothetical protein